MRIDGLPHLALTLATLATVLLLSGCATKAPAPRQVVMFPPPPDEPRIQYLWSFGAEGDLGGRSRLSEFVVGEENVHRPIIKPYGVAIQNGKIYVCDTQAGNVSISDLKTRRLKYFKPAGQGALQLPVNIAVDDDGTMYITDTGREQLLVFSADGQLRYTLGQKGELKPSAVALTSDRIFITDMRTSAVRVYDKRTREQILSFPPKSDNPDQRLFQPTNLAIDSEGRIFVSDSGGFAVKIFDTQGNHLQTLGELGVTPGQFALPKGIGADRSGRLYVLDAAAPVIQLFDRDGSLLMFFGQPSKSGEGGLYLPAGLTIDYDHVAYFQKYVAPGYSLEYLILVTNQLGPKKVSVYGFLKKV